MIIQGDARDVLKTIEAETVDISLFDGEDI